MCCAGYIGEGDERTLAVTKDLAVLYIRLNHHHQVHREGEGGEKDRREKERGLGGEGERRKKRKKHGCKEEAMGNGYMEKSEERKEGRS